MKNNVDFGFRIEDMDGSSFCQQKPYSCTARYYTVYLTVLYALWLSTKAYQNPQGHERSPHSEQIQYIIVMDLHMQAALAGWGGGGGNSTRKVHQDVLVHCLIQCHGMYSLG